MPAPIRYVCTLIDRTHAVELDSQQGDITFQRLVDMMRYGRRQHARQSSQQQSAGAMDSDPTFQYTDEDGETVSISSQREVGEMMRAALRMHRRRQQQQAAAAAAADQSSGADLGGSLVLVPSDGAETDEEEKEEIVRFDIYVLQDNEQAGAEESGRMEQHDLRLDHMQTASMSPFVLLDSAGEESHSAADLAVDDHTNKDERAQTESSEVKTTKSAGAETSSDDDSPLLFSFDKMAHHLHAMWPMMLAVLVGIMLGSACLLISNGPRSTLGMEAEYPIAVRGSGVAVAPEMHVAQAAIAEMVLNLHHKIARMEAREAAWKHEQQRAELRRLKEEEARAKQPLARLGAVVNEGVEIVADKISHMPEQARQQAARLRVLAAEARAGLESLGQQLTGQCRAWEEQFHWRMGAAADAARQVSLLLDDKVREVDREVEERSAPVLHDARVKWQQAKVAAGQAARAAWSSFVHLIHLTDSWINSKGNTVGIEWQQQQQPAQTRSAAQCANARRVKFQQQAQSDAWERNHAGW